MSPRLLIRAGLALAATGFLAWLLLARPGAPEAPGERKAAEVARAVPVEVAPLEHGPIEQRRTFTGTLEPRAELAVASKIDGRIEALTVDLADTVTRGQVVARLDNDEHVQELARAQAELAVAEANLTEAESLLVIAERELERVDKLRDRGVSSESQRDVAKADQLAKQAHVKVSEAEVMRAQAQLATARIRLGYTEVTAQWRGDDGQRVVAERYVEEGETVSANDPMLRVVGLDPIEAVFFVTERDYALLAAGQEAELRTDAYPRGVFRGRVARIAPVFRETTRQARVELRVDNPDLRLKPGMFVRATLVLERVEDAVIVPEEALAIRDGEEGVFLLDPGGETVSWRPVRPGIRQGGRVQVSGEGLAGRVVTLGHQLLDDGSTVTLSDASGGEAP